MLHPPTAPDEQKDIVAALESGSATGDDQPLKRVDTHMSHVFLGPEAVYKLKRSLRHPFCDMSSLEQRRAACEAELAVNRALAPDLYEAVLPVVRDAAGALRIGVRGETVDWVVKMRRFPNGALLEEMADAGRLTPDHLRQAATAVAGFHATLAPHTEVGHAIDYRRIIEGLRRTEAAGAAALGVEPASQALFSALEREVARLSPIIEARRKAGWVRRGHGDLHLRNICMFKGRVMPFDALEFDPALATADVIYDVAFLLMDLRARGLHDLANVAMNHYWDASAQPEEGLALLPLFMALRAAVRMAVAVEAGDLVLSARYRALGVELLRPAPPPLLVAVGGLSGTGKSTLAAVLAPELTGPCGGRWLRTDTIRKVLAGVKPGTRLTAETYQPEARATIYRVLAQHARAALEANTSILADATFREDPTRAAIEGAASGCRFLGLWLTAPTEVRVARVAQRHGDASDATPKVALEQVEPKELGPAWHSISADRPIEALAAAICSQLARRASQPGRDPH